MRILTDTKTITHEEWLEYRRTGIGGSDASTICGLNPYSSLIELWAGKTGRISSKTENEAMRQGHDFEDYVARRFCEATGKKVRRRNAIFQHDTYDFITANIDREVIGENAGLECKTTNLYNKSDFENGEIPLTYLVQCRHYMNVMGYEKMYLAVCVLSKAFYWFEIPYDKDEGEALLRMEIDFWNSHILPDVRPEPDGSESAARVLGQLYGTQRDDSTVLFGADDTAAEIAGIKAEIKELERRQSELQQKMITQLDGCTEGVTDRYRITWKDQSRTSLDSKALRQAYPEIYSRFSKTTSSRVFRLTERK